MRRGTYLHYKGRQYEVIGIATHSETHEKLVIYKQMSAYGGFKKGALWIRPKKMFLEKVTIKGKKTPRFKYVSE